MSRVEEDMIIFRKRWQHLVDKIAKYEPAEYNEIIITLLDGRKLLYDPLGSTIRWYHDDKEDVKGFDENRWRTGFSARLTILMREKGVHRWELAEATGISEVTLTKYATGQSTPSLFNARKIAKVIGCSLDELGDF